MTNGVRAVFANIVTADEESLRKDITNLVRKTFDETFKVLIDEEASELVEAEYYERMACRRSCCSGHYARKLVSGVGESSSARRNYASPSRWPSSSATAGARPRSRRPSSRCASRVP